MTTCGGPAACRRCEGMDTIPDGSLGFRRGDSGFGNLLFTGNGLGLGISDWGFPRSGSTFMGIPMLRMIAFEDRDLGTLNHEPYTSVYIPMYPYISLYISIYPEMSLYDLYNPYITPYITPYSLTYGNYHLGYPRGYHAQDRDAA